MQNSESKKVKKLLKIYILFLDTEGYIFQESGDFLNNINIAWMCGS